MEYRKFKQAILEEIDCFVHDYNHLKNVLLEMVDDIEKLEEQEKKED